jgi:ATP-dependent protease HslVU (ClpYQ) peptidase subunit
MTIAAGFRCNEGIIMCCDSEFSYSDVRLRGQKMVAIIAPHLAVRMVAAFAGWADLSRMLVRKLDEGLQKQKKALWSEAEFCNFLERTLKSFHEDHIFTHPRYGYADGPSVELAIAASLNNQPDLSLFSTQETAVNLEGEFVTVGSGKGFADYIVIPLTAKQFRGMNRKDIVLLATHMLCQVKMHAPGCGGMSNFAMVGRDGHLYPVTDWEIPSHEYYSQTFREILRDLFFAMGDLDLDDRAIQQSIDIAKQRAHIIREEQKAETEKRQKLIERMTAFRGTFNP